MPTSELNELREAVDRLTQEIGKLRQSLDADLTTKQLPSSVDQLTNEIEKLRQSLGGDLTLEKLPQLQLSKEWSQTPIGYILAMLRKDLEEVKEKADDAYERANEAHEIIEELPSEIEE